MTERVSNAELTAWRDCYSRWSQDVALLNIGRLINEVAVLQEEIVGARAVICLERSGHQFEDGVCFACGFKQADLEYNDSP
jgi:hypothetical protein